VLPGDLLIADKLNNRLLVVDPQGRIRWRFPRKGDLRPGQTFRIPDDAFFSPDGRRVIATEEDDFVIRVIDVTGHRLVYTYGKPAVPGHVPDRLWNPDDAVLLPDGRIVTADIKNQRLLVIGPHSHHPAKSWGSPNAGYHDPPHHYGAPNGALPMGHGRFLVTEIRGDWVDAIDLHGHVFWSTHVPGVSYPSDSNRIGPDRFLSVDYSNPGQIVIFNRHGHTMWRFAPRGRNQLDHPSLALPLPNGDIVCNDDYNHRVIVVDPQTNKIVWQYGHTGVAGHRPGHLDNPDGLDLVPPNSLIDRTLGRS
jgi:DNA-binding beta-propeller fold protein YncE